MTIKRIPSDMIEERGTGRKLSEQIIEVNEQLAEIPNQTYITEKAKSVDVNNALALKSDKSYVDTELEKKRDNATKLTNADLDTSTDTNKIKLINLAEEVQAAMAGTAPVISSVADKSLTSTKYADESVIATALNQEYDFRGTIIGGDANTLTKSGIYFLTSTSLNIPAATSIMLYVQKYGTRIVQIARRFDNPTISWVRGGDVSNIGNLTWKTDIAVNGITTEFISNKAVTKEKIADKTIEAAQLSSGYNYRGFFSGNTVDANNLLDDGRYYLASSVLNLPKRNYFGTELVSVILEVEKYNTRIIQKARPINYPDEVYYRYTDSTFTGVEWKLLQRAIKPLYGKNVILMGDSLTDKGKQHLTIWEKTGANVDKIGIGGTTMSNHGNSADYSKLSFYSLAKAISNGIFTDQETAVANIYNSSSGATDLNAWLTKFKAINWSTINYILVRYGTNDHAMDNPIGAIDRTNLDTSTYIGAFNQGVKDILIAYPHIRIFVATPLWRYSVNIGTGGDSDIVANNNGDYMVDFVDALGTSSKFNHLPFHDYYRQSGINTYTNTYYLSDQTHPNDAGSILIGEIDSNFLTSN